MKKIIIAVLLFVPGIVRAQFDVSGAFNFMASDLKENTRFKIDSAIPAGDFDWKKGTWFYGSAVPFAQVGSYLYFAGIGGRSSDGQNLGSVASGLRLNDTTRLLVQKLWSAIPGANNNAPLGTALANSLSTGISAGHNFSDPSTSKVAFNSIGIYFGFEVAFGGSSSGNSSSAFPASQSAPCWYLK